MKSWAGCLLVCAAVAAGTSGWAQTSETKPVVTPPATPAVVEATPALWKVKGAHGTVYFFGSVHVMKPEVHWETAKVKDALGGSGTLYLEIADVSEDAQKAMQPEIIALGLDQEHALSTKISKEDVDLLDTAVKALGMPGEKAMEPMQPWLAWTVLSVLPAIKAGYDPASGIDKVLQEEAQAGKKEVKGLETASEQLHMLAGMPMDLQVKLLHVSLADLPSEAGRMSSMVEDWKHGDVEAIAKLENDDMKAKVPELYDLMIVKRNERMADTLAGVLKDPATGTVFVAIGAAHLAGPDSVLKLLEKRGFPAVRVE